MGFTPDQNDKLAEAYAKLTGIVKPPTLSEIIKEKDKSKKEGMKTHRFIVIKELKDRLRKYYEGKAEDIDLYALNMTFYDAFKDQNTHSFVKDKNFINKQVNNKLEQLKNDSYSLDYLGKLLRRIANDKIYLGKNLTDDQMTDIAKQYNPEKFDFSDKYYYEKFKEALPTVRNWLE